MGNGRLARLLARNVPVTVKLNIGTKFGSDHSEGENVLGDIEGTNPKLRDQIVMLGAHLDSWATVTGATDDGGRNSYYTGGTASSQDTQSKTATQDSDWLVGRRGGGHDWFTPLCGTAFCFFRRSDTEPWTALPEWKRPVPPYFKDVIQHETSMSRFTDHQADFGYRTRSNGRAEISLEPS